MPVNGHRTAVKVNLNEEAYNQPQLHNRWHPDIPTAATIKPGEVVNVECVDWTGGQIGNNDSAEDIKNVDLTRVHYLSGPIEVEGAMPGDVLCVEILEIQPFPEQQWGFGGIFHKDNGGGFLDEHYGSAAKAIWDFEGIYASSRHVPGVRFPGIIHPGLIGCAPSQELLELWNEREAGLVAANKDAPKDVAKLPEVKGAHAGAAKDSLQQRIMKEGARTVPPREHGGNCDIKNLSRGSKSYLPVMTISNGESFRNKKEKTDAIQVYVPGAKLSLGDLHFSQGDGEISFCGAIEMAGIVTLKCSVIKNGVKDMAMRNPIFVPGPVQPQFGSGRMLTFEGISVDENGKQHFLDATVAYRQACLNCVEYLKRFGYTGEQVYLYLSAAPVEATLASVVDIPNACCTLGIPVDCFEFDILPKQGVPQKQITTNCPIAN